MVPNCMNATTAVAPVTSTGPKYGIELKTPGQHPPDRRLLQAEPRNASHVATATTVLVNTCTSRNHSICRSISSRICTVIFFFVSDGPTIFTSLRLIQIARGEQEEDEEQNQHELADRGRERPANPTPDSR